MCREVWVILTHLCEAGTVVLVVVVLASVDSGARATGVSPTIVEHAVASSTEMTGRLRLACFRGWSD